MASEESVSYPLNILPPNNISTFQKKNSFLFSAPRTYIDVLARPIIQLATEGEIIASYYFCNLNTKLNYYLSDKNRLYLSAYAGSDRF